MGLAHRVAAYPVEVYQSQPMIAAGLMTASAAPLSAIRPHHRIMVVEPARRWYGTIIDRLNVLCSLRKGWDGYDADPVAFDTAHFALSMLEAICLSDAPAPSIIPGPNGDLQVEWHSDSTDIELHVLAPNEVRAWRSATSAEADGEEIALTTDFTVVAGWIKDLVELTGAAQATAA